MRPSLSVSRYSNRLRNFLRTHRSYAIICIEGVPCITSSEITHITIDSVEQKIQGMQEFRLCID